MKKICLTVLFGALFLLACPELTRSADDIAGYYPFSGNANDESGLGNNGVVYGAQLTKDRSGEEFRAYNFDGENDYIGLPRSPSLYSHIFTISAWIKIKEYGASLNAGSVIYSNYANWNGLFFSITSTGKVGIRVHSGDPNVVEILGDTNISKNIWHHVVCVYDGVNLSVYLDGFLDGIKAPSFLYNPIMENADPAIGKPSWASCINEPACFNGAIDDVRLYNYAFSDSDVQKLYNTEKPENKNFSFVHLTDVHLGSNPLLIWHEEQSYPRFADTLYEISRLPNKPDFILIGGDNVEYAGGESGLRYLRDFKSMIDSFTANTGIAVYVVPGNHDRYERPVLGLPFLTGGDDKLENYHKVMTELPANEILFFNETLNNEISGDAGYNRYNYYFTDKHKGVKFIGMDSGEDNHETMDSLPESEGLSDMHINILENMEYEMPKVVFMHSPVYNDFRMGADLDYWFNGAILHNLPEFLGGFCSVYNTKLILSGHTHQSEIYDLYGNKIEEPAFENTRLATTTHPLFIQTQSATDDNDNFKHGYRIIDVEDGNIFPRTPSITDFKPKVIIDLCIDHGGYFVSDPALGTNEYVSYKDFTCDNNISLKFFNPWTLDVQYITPQGENVNFPKNASFFTASSSNRLILYDDDFLERSKIEIYNPFFNERQYNLVARRDNYEIKNLFYDDTVGLRINNTKFGTYPFILASSDENQLMIFKNIAIHPNSGQKLIINWDIFQGDNGTAGFLLSGDMNNNGIIENDEQADSSNAQLLPLKYTVDLGSPGELRVYNGAGEISGLIGMEIKEDIPYSIYVSEDEKVIIFSDDSENNNYKYEVAGTADDTYDLEIKSEKEGEDAVIFTA
ncbi:MAG: LamG-like jellyroll fold domain-containing protein, partial [bacterium]